MALSIGVSQKNRLSIGASIATVVTVCDLSGSFEAVSSASGLLSTVLELSGLFESTSGIFAELSNPKNLIGSIDIVSTVEDAVLETESSFIGSVVAVSSVTGILGFRPNLSGSISAISSISGGISWYSPGYELQEISEQDSQPIELYDFQYGSTPIHWRYSSSSYEVNYLDNKYFPEVILSSDIEQNMNVLGTEIELIIKNWDNPFVQQYLEAIPDEKINLTIYRGNGSDFVTYWNGRVGGVRFLAEREVSVKCSPLVCDMNRDCLTLRFSRQCCVPLYSSPACGVLKEDFERIGIIDAISDTGKTIQSTTFSAEIDGFFRGGYIYVNNRRRKITYHVGNTIRIHTKVSQLLINQVFRAYAGCDHLYTTCHQVFGNVYNCKADPFLPDTNPFAGNPVV